MTKWIVVIEFDSQSEALEFSQKTVSNKIKYMSVHRAQECKSCNDIIRDGHAHKCDGEDWTEL